MTGVAADLATLRGIVSREVRGRAAARVEAELSRLTKDAEHWAHECLAAEQQVSRLTQERDAARKEAKHVWCEKAFDQQKARAEAAETEHHQAEAAIADLLSEKEAAERALADTREALNDATEVAVWLTGLGEIPTDSAWPEMREKLNKALSLAGLSATPETQPAAQEDCEHDYVYVGRTEDYYRCDKCEQSSKDGVHPRVGPYAAQEEA